MPKTLIIAEIGVNHEGSVQACAELIEAAANAVKLQTVKAELNYAKDTESYKIFSRSELTRTETYDMFELARSLGCEPFTTVGDFKTLQWVAKLQPRYFKISSGLLTCTPLIKEIAKLNRHVILSTGLAHHSDIKVAVDVVKKYNCDFSLLQCTSLYPAPQNKLNLNSIGWLAGKFNCPVGFSDHSLGFSAAAIAVAAGAKTIEKHFTLDSSRPSYDHHISLMPNEFSRMVNEIRAVEKMLGSDGKPLNQLQKKQRQVMGRYIGTITKVTKGETASPENIGFIRFKESEGELLPNAWESVLGKKFIRSLDQGTAVSKCMLSGS